MTSKLCCACLLWVISLMSSASAQKASQTGGCAPALSVQEKKALLEYVRKQYKLPESTSLALSVEHLVKDTCYRELTFEGTSPIRTWRLTLYASPDQRFLSTDLLDTSVDPEAEQSKRDQAILNAISVNKGAAVGPEQAPVTIVEFADFECPFCRTFAALLHDVLPREKDQVRMVFHHYPLANHAWARTAAEGAACAQLQGAGAFWSVHDQLFENQPLITVANVKTKLLEFAATAPLDVAALKECLDSQMSLGLVFQDLDLASAYGVRGTPTIFINGEKVQPPKDAEGLRRLIRDAQGRLDAERSPEESHGAKGSYTERAIAPKDMGLPLQPTTRAHYITP